MTLHLAGVSRSVTAAAYAVLVCDGAGWRKAGGHLRVPSDITLLRRLDLAHRNARPHPIHRDHAVDQTQHACQLGDIAHCDNKPLVNGTDLSAMGDGHRPGPSQARITAEPRLLGRLGLPAG